MDPVVSQNLLKQLKMNWWKKIASINLIMKRITSNSLKIKDLDKDMKHAVKGNEDKTVYISHDSIGYLAALSF